MKKFIELADKRYSSRKYKKDLIPDEILERILQAAILAPTAVNKQPFRLIVVKNPKETLKDLRQGWALEAPVIIVVFAVPDEAWVRKYDNKNYSFVDTTIAFDHLILAATDEGLATCWIAANDPEMIKKALQVPDKWEFVALTPLGYANDESKQTKRKKASDLVSYIN
jgi:nitroreductase